MPDSRRLPLSLQDEAALRDGQIDVLLDDGLERYFAARYEEAIHLWTRVLFLDRSHARARAYIERARTALAEMQRRSDELLQASRELLEQGETDAARRLLTEAVAGSGDELQAATLLVRLERLERVRTIGRAIETAPRTVAPDSRWFWRRAPRRTIGFGVAIVLVTSVAALLVQGENILEDGGLALGTARAGALTVAPVPSQFPVLTSSEVALVRARTSVARGRLSEALLELDRVGPDSPDRPAADQLRIELQQLLMASARSSSATTITEPIRR